MSGDNSEGSDARDVTDATALALSDPYKVLGDIADSNGGIGVLGRNTATSGTTKGVEGRVDSSEGYGLATPDDALVKGVVDTDATDFVVAAGTTSTTDAKNVVQGHASNSIEDGAVGGTIAGGGRDNGTADESNVVYDDYGTIGGGFKNQAGDSDSDPTTSEYATVGGGKNNEASGDESTVGGGVGNKATSTSATVAGGDGNEVGNADGTVCGGQGNYAGYYASVLGGSANQANGGYSTAGGGYYNIANGEYATVAGGEYNRANGNYATVAGGGPTDSNNPSSTNNVAAGKFTTIGGGGGNEAYNDGGTIAGGKDNQVGKSGTTNSEAFVGGGTTNRAKGTQSVVVGGYNNEVTAGTLQGFIGGGYLNTVSAKRGTIPGGRSNDVTGAHGFAAGYNAEANNSGAFVWADDQGSTRFRSDAHYDSGSNNDPTGSNTFNVRSYGGVRFVTGNGNVTYISSGSTGWTTSSSRSVKTNVESVDPETALAGVESMEVATWEYEGEDGEGAGTTHIGPMAEDFHEAFDVGDSDSHINSINADGAAFAAIQGLSERLADREERIDDQADRIEALERENDRLRERLDELEARVTADDGGSAPAPADD